MSVKKLKRVKCPLLIIRSVNTRQFTNHTKMETEMIPVVPVDVPVAIPVEKKRGRPVDEAKRAAKEAAKEAAKAEKEAAKAVKAQQKEAEKEAKAAAKKAEKEAKEVKAKEAKNTQVLNPEEPTDQSETIRALQAEVETLRAQLAAIKAIVC